MEQSLFKNIPTYLDLNGPNLSFTVNPSGTTNGNPNGSLSLIGIATASFPNVADNAGSLAYQWYEVGVGKLTDGGRIAGSATTTLTISNLVTPDDNGRQLAVAIDKHFQEWADLSIKANKEGIELPPHPSYNDILQMAQQLLGGKKDGNSNN